MDTDNSQIDSGPTIEELIKENRSLKRKFALAETNYNRLLNVSSTLERVESILYDSFKKELQFFQLVLENMTNILLLFDFDGRFAYASNAFLQRTGIKDFSSINGCHYMDVLRSLVSEQKNNVLYDAINEANTEKRTVSIELEIDFCFKDLPRIYSILVTPMLNEHGNITGTMALFNDITELVKTSEKAQAASKAKGDFLSNMSHEMRTPMNAIIGMTAIGKKAPDIVGKDHAFNRIGDASSHLLGVINDILDMAKIEADKLELSPIEYHFDNMLGKVLTVIHFRADEKKQILTFNIDSSIPKIIVGDDQRLAQVLTNLLSNAVKFTNEGGRIHLEAILIEETENNCILQIEVHDNGIGISSGQQDKLFNAFEQADGGTSRIYGGTGLGLAITKRIVEMMGGAIRIESVLGKGSKFIVTVKVGRGSKRESPADGQALETDVFPSGQPKDIFVGKRLLVAEDVEINREILITLLDETGIVIDCAETGKEALDM
ncbi:MAG: ATP-binding protein, partial [Defluviitaleaceae bacterium]|nr:ATP-binding protein [Defluviitaleaceae bacterium]